MKKRFISLVIMILFTLNLCSCGSVVVEPPVITPGTDPINPGPNDPGLDTIVEYTVCLMMDKKLYIPKEGEIINAYWKDDYSEYKAQIDETGYAKIKLDGDFSVYIDNTPDDYTYNPNIYNASAQNPKIEIELLRLSRPRGTGKSEYQCIKITNTGNFRATLEKPNQKLFYEYSPKSNGYYYIESIVNLYDGTINPLIDTYNGTTGAKFFSSTIDKGGNSLKDGYTKNFRWIVQLTEQQVGNCFTFAVYANTSTGIYPIIVDFQIIYIGEHLSDSTISAFMEAKEANFITPEYDSTKYDYYNSNGGKGSYYSGPLNGSKILDGNSYRYNEETGYYHFYDKTNKTYGPILCAKITEPCAYYEDALSRIEYHGNKALTVSNGTENYKQFIEIEYAACCNSDGVCYVTEELKQFLQKFSISQRLFMDGNGFVEYAGVYASEEDQWLFACGFYKEK